MENCEKKEKGVWVDELDNCLVEQPSCEVQNPQRKQGDCGEKIPGCQCKNGQFHSNRNENTSISYGPCLDEDGCMVKYD